MEVESGLPARVEVGFVCDAPLPRAWTAFWESWDYWERADRGDPRSLVQGKGARTGKRATR